ncbi:hypothetical protein PoB_002331100 [Plakobranchus ocellatus]|uniref:Uncharacterized protein n=1 Tax=Plakobranchus ocellatus TaxID=259542 RepID=A0AAV3ZQM3_9GAST|nr:hypothetical protein PoB_002331100 [Plakobranchus ocellatus]
MYNQLALKTSQRRTSDGYEVLPGERMSGYYAHIVEDTHMADVYESMSDEGSPEDILCNRQVSCPNNYQRISLDNIKTLPQAISTHSHNYEALLKKSKSCGDLTDGRADISEYFNMKAPIEQEPEPFYSTVGRQTSEKEEQPRLQWFMLRNSKDDIHLDYAFDSTEAHKSTELRDFSTRKHCAADADGEGEYLTVLDSSNEYEGYIKFDGSDVTVIKF